MWQSFNQWVLFLFCYFFKVFFFFSMWNILSSLLNFFQYSFYFINVLALGPWRLWGLSSLIRDRTSTPCIRKQSLHHWPTGEVLPVSFRWKYCGWHLENLKEAGHLSPGLGYGTWNLGSHLGLTMGALAKGWGERDQQGMGESCWGTHGAVIMALTYEIKGCYYLKSHCKFSLPASLTAQ